MSECSTASLSSAPTQARQRYSKIQQALSANKLVDEKLRRLESILVCRLSQCRTKLKEVVETPVSLDKQDKGFKYVNCGKPYFRDKDNFPPPENEDTILMAKSNMYDFSSVIAVPGWTVKDKSECLSIIHKMSIDIRKKELNSKLAQLERDFKKFKTNQKKHEKQMEAVKMEIDCLKKNSLNELALPIDRSKYSK